MNKYQKEISREIRDIMRTDRFGRMTYKEAKRKWRKGIRAFPVGDTNLYESFDLGRLGLSRDKMREVGQVYADILEYSVMNGLDFSCKFESDFDRYVLYFTGRNYNTGKRYGSCHAIASDVIRESTCSLVYLAKYILEKLDLEVKAKGIGPRPEYKIVPIYDSMVLPPLGFFMGGA